MTAPRRALRQRTNGHQLCSLQPHAIAQAPTQAPPLTSSSRRRELEAGSRMHEEDREDRLVLASQPDPP
jgi:hypothetical protein